MGCIACDMQPRPSSCYHDHCTYNTYLTNKAELNRWARFSARGCIQACMTDQAATAGETHSHSHRGMLMLMLMLFTPIHSKSTHLGPFLRASSEHTDTAEFRETRLTPVHLRILGVRRSTRHCERLFQTLLLFDRRRPLNGQWMHAVDAALCHQSPTAGTGEL